MLIICGGDLVILVTRDPRAALRLLHVLLLLLLICKSLCILLLLLYMYVPLHVLFGVG